MFKKESLKYMCNINKNYLLFATKLFALSGIMALCAQITIPLPYVPFSLQTLGLIIIGLSIERRIAFASIILYIVEGCLGMPVFSSGGFGISKILGPSGGYIIGCIPAIYILGFIVDKVYINKKLRCIIAIILSEIVLFFCGLMQLSLFIPAEEVFVIGLYPFITAEIIKMILAIGIVSGIEIFQKKTKH